MSAFLRKGAAIRFESGKGVTLVDHCHRGFDLVGPAAREFWLQRLTDVASDAFAALAGQIPTMSEVGRTLATELLVRNRRRLLDG